MVRGQDGVVLGLVVLDEQRPQLELGLRGATGGGIHEGFDALQGSSMVGLSLEDFGLHEEGMRAALKWWWYQLCRMRHGCR